MKTIQESTMNGRLNHDALLSRIQDSLNFKEIVPPFRYVELPLFSNKVEFEVSSKYNEKFLYALYRRAIEISQLRFKTVGVFQLGANFLRHVTDYSKISIESNGIVFSDENFISGNWNVQVYTNEAQDEDLKNRAPTLILNFDKNNPRHKSTFNELSPYFAYSDNVKIRNVTSNEYSQLLIPSKFLFYLSW